jgi:hypothetical protein
MAVHHTKIKQAMAIGCHLSLTDNDRYRIFWPQRSVELFEHTANEALHEMEAVQNILKHSPDYRIIPVEGSSTVILLNQLTGKNLANTPSLPSEIWAIIEAGEDRWVEPLNGPGRYEKVEDGRISGISKNGAVAYKEGVPAADCPYLEGSDDFSRWNDEWDEAADKHEEEATKPSIKGSVITNEYRARYSESGHPTHCGDELAILLNNLCLNKAGINMELFEAICMANGVDLSHYSRTARGWQGLLRMTGRNMLAKRVKENKGKVLMPLGMMPDVYQLSGDWVTQAEIKYKPKSKPNV